MIGTGGTEYVYIVLAVGIVHQCIRGSVVTLAVLAVYEVAHGGILGLVKPEGTLSVLRGISQIGVGTVGVGKFYKLVVGAVE